MTVSWRKACGACHREMKQDDEWITLDGGEIWCADCWAKRFGGVTPAHEGARVATSEAAVEDVMNSIPCVECGHLCPPSFDVCPACGGSLAKKPGHSTPAIDFSLEPAGGAPSGAPLPSDGGQGGWYYRVGDQQVGPLPTEALGRMIRAGQIGENVMIWRNGMDSWSPLALVPELAPLAAQGPGVVPILPAAQEFVRHNGKSKTTAGILALLIGGLGVHKFYLGGWGWGILYIIFVWTFFPAIVAFVEGIIYFTMSDRVFDETYNRREVSAFTW